MKALVDLCYLEGCWRRQ